MARYRINKLGIILSALLLALPIEIYSVDDMTGLTLADALPLVLLLCVRELRFDNVGAALFLFLIVSLISALYGALYTVRSIASWAYFIKPLMAYFLAVTLCRSYDDRYFFIKVFSVFHGIFIFLLMPLVIEDATILRSSINFYSIEIFGETGTNAFAVYNSISACLAMIAMLTSKKKLLKIFYFASIIVSSYIIFASISRQGLLSLLIFALAFIFVLWRRSAFNRVAIITVLTPILVYLIHFAIVNFESLSWAFKIMSNIEDMRAGNLDGLSARRTIVYREVLAIAFSHPIFGVGFTGFAVFESQVLKNTFGYTVGLSPHNQWLGAFWKMGIFAFFMYIFFYYVLVCKFLRTMNKQYIDANFMIKILISVFFVFLCNTQDALTYPLSGYLMMFLLGLYKLPASCEYHSMGTNQFIAGSNSKSQELCTTLSYKK